MARVKGCGAYRSHLLAAVGVPNGRHLAGDGSPVGRLALKHLAVGASANAPLYSRDQAVEDREQFARWVGVPRPCGPKGAP